MCVCVSTFSLKISQLGPTTLKRLIVETYCVMKLNYCDIYYKYGWESSMHL